MGSQLSSPLAEDLPAPANCLYIAGTGRNGSTLLGMMLAQHPDAFFAGEITHIWRRGYLENQLCGCGQPFSDCEFWNAVTSHAFGKLSKTDLRQIESCRDRVSSFWRLPSLLLGRRPSGAQFDSYRETHECLVRSISIISGCSHVVDSSKYPTDLSNLTAGELPFRIIHLIRDCRAVVHSWRTKKNRPEIHWKQQDMPRYGTGKTALAWRVFNSAIERQGRSLPNHYRTLRYEDLVGDPTSVTKSLTDWADLPDNAQLKSEPNRLHSVAGNPCRFDFDPNSIKPDDRWREQRQPFDRFLVRIVCGRMQHRYGYLD